MGWGPRGQRGILCWASPRMAYVTCTAKDTAPERQESPTITHLTGKRYTVDKICQDRFHHKGCSPNLRHVCYTSTHTQPHRCVYKRRKRTFVFISDTLLWSWTNFGKRPRTAVILWMNCFNWNRNWPRDVNVTLLIHLAGSTKVLYTPYSISDYIWGRMYE